MDLKISLLKNSHTFIEEALQKAVLAENDPIQWKYAIFSLIQSIELILKERLRQENNILIYQNIDKPQKTVGLDLAIERLTKIASLQFSESDLDAIQKAKKWRDLIVHYEFDIIAKELKLLFSRLLGFSMQFNKRELNIMLDTEVNPKLWDEALKIFEYSNELYDRAEILIRDEKIHFEFIWLCPNCGYNTFIIEDEINKCYVCGYTDDVSECPNCNTFHFDSQLKQILVNRKNYVKICEDCFNKEIEYYEEE